MEGVYNTMIGGIAVFTKTPWYIKLLHTLRLSKGVSFSIIVDDFTIDKEFIDILKKNNIKLDIYRPKKAYNWHEASKFVLEIIKKSDDSFTKVFNICEYAEVANTVRPNTFKKKAKRIKDVASNKFYTKVF